MLTLPDAQGPLALDPEREARSPSLRATPPGAPDIVRVFDTCPACTNAHALLSLAARHATTEVCRRARADRRGQPPKPTTTRRRTRKLFRAAPPHPPLNRTGFRLPHVPCTAGSEQVETLAFPSESSHHPIARSRCRNRAKGTLSGRAPRSLHWRRLVSDRSPIAEAIAAPRLRTWPSSAATGRSSTRVRSAARASSWSGVRPPRLGRCAAARRSARSRACARAGRAQAVPVG